MEYKELSNGMKIPAIGMGTWGIGGEFKADASRMKEEVKAIQEGIKLGITHIDTAEFYGQGQAEKVVGTAIKKFDRKKLFITTKVWHTNLNYGNAISSLENSLKRLQTDYVDLYLIHWPNPRIPINETMKAMEHMAEQGKIKAIGVSNFSVHEIKEAQQCLKSRRIAANQIEYNLLKREADKDVLPFCIKNKIIVVAYKPLARGKLCSKGIKILDDIAEKYSKTNSQIAIKWAISHENVIAIAKSTNVGHLKQNIDVFGWELKPEDKAQLDRISYQ